MRKGFRLELDLREAAIAGDEAFLDLSVVMGGIEIRIPRTWRVASELSPVLGSVEDATHPDPDAPGTERKPRLVLRGSVAMGAVTLTN